MAIQKKPAAKRKKATPEELAMPAPKKRKGKPAPAIDDAAARPSEVGGRRVDVDDDADEKPKKPRKKATAPPPPPDESKLSWSVNPAEETWGTTVEPVRRWSTKCGRYDVVRVKPAEEREYFGATKVSKDGGKVCFESDKMGPGYPKKYATLDAAMESVEVHHAALHRLPGVTSNRDAVVNQAEKMGLSRRVAPASPKPAPTARVATERKPTTPRTGSNKMSGLGAAALVLKEAGEPLTCKQMIEAMASKGYWTSPGGKTPDATLSAAIGKDIRAKQKDSGFKKVGVGLYAAN